MWPWLARAALAASSGADAQGAHQEGGDVVGGRGGEGDEPTARADRGEDVLHGRRAQQPDRAGGRLLDRLEEGVARLLGQPVGVLDDHDLPAVAGG